MNIFLWFLQILLAIHTAVGAGWKLSNSEQTIPSLNAIPHTVWIGLSVFEIICSIALILPLFINKLRILIPIATLFIAAEMLFFCAVHLYSGNTENSQMIYWLIVAGICGFIAYGRVKLKI